MSNTNTNAVEYDVTVDDVSAPAPKKKNVASRIFAALLVAISVAAIFLPINIIVDKSVEEANLLSFIMAVIGGEVPETLFGFIPVFSATDSLISDIAGIAPYVLILMIVLTVVCGIVTVFSGKGLRGTAFFFTTGFVCYTMATLLDYSLNGIIPSLNLATLLPMACAGVGMILYFVLAVIKNKGKGVVNTLQTMLSMEVTLEIVYAMIVVPAVFHDALFDLGVGDELIFIIKLIVVAVLFLNMIISAIRMQTKKGLALDLVRYIVQLVLSGALCYLTLADEMVMLYAIVGAGISLLQIIICIIQMVCAKKKAKKAKAAEEVAPAEEVAEEPAAPAVEEEYVQEEYVEAVPYDGGPVAGVEVAEEVTPCEEPAPAPQVETAGYDFYNSRSFDAFIASLSSEERNQFTELFILKYKGVMPEIPDYQVGGDNKEFFRKIFIYLGQYRDRIPDGLLAKIYQFAVRM